MTPEEQDEAYHTLITCDGKGKEAKADALRRLIEWHRQDVLEQRAACDADGFEEREFIRTQT